MNLKAPRILLTLMALEYFGPALRDANASHATNPDWVGHARFHMVWFIAMMVALGAVNLYLVWGRKPAQLRDLAVSAAFQGCTLFGFWSACVLVDGYGGLIFVPGIHFKVLGLDENVFAFIILSTTWLAAVALLVRAHRSTAKGTAP